MTYAPPRPVGGTPQKASRLQSFLGLSRDRKAVYAAVDMSTGRPDGGSRPWRPRPR